MLGKFPDNLIELPRNFSFISRLPSRFMLGILSEGNQTPKGIWYQVNIMGHTLNLLSRQKLTAGKSYLVEKKSPLVIKILEEKDPVQKNQPADKTLEGKNATSALKQEEIPAASMEKWQLSFEDLSGNFNMGDFLNALGIHFLQDEAGTEIYPEKGAWRFSIRPLAEDPLMGVFLLRPDGVHLYLSSTPEGREFLGQHLEEIKHLLDDLDIKKVDVVDEQKLNSLKAGIDIKI